MSPLLSHVYELGMMEALALPQTECFTSAVQFARAEGIVAAPESSHAIAAAVREAQVAKETGEEKAILIALSGHGHFDLAAYDAFLSGTMVDEETTPERFAEALAALPQV
jgi:tryptophan synthase beta chain